MGEVKNPKEVKLVLGIIVDGIQTFEKTKEIIKTTFGDIDIQSKIISFEHTDYYKKEMGDNLLRLWVSNEELVNEKELAEIKLKTNDIEKTLVRKDGSRRINLDPGYLTLSKFVLTSTKDYAHRIYIGKGIYGEVTLIYRNRSFQVLEWTYPDYRERTALEFFEKVRNKYIKQLRGEL